ncbi:MAG: membrane protein [Nitrospirales bacterium]|nr:MAG: membrane protein [Nitrospirales bacterium]
MPTDILDESKQETLTNPSDQAPAEGKAVEDFFDTNEIFLRVLATAHHEIHRPIHTFAWGALAAGLIIGMSFLAQAVVTTALPEGRAYGLLGNLLYPIGFIIVILGRYPLYTENTLTPVILTLTRFASLPDLLRVWGIALALNLLGVVLFTFLLANTGIFSNDVAEVAKGLGEHLFQTTWDTAFFKSLLAGWLLASLVWLVHAARDTVARLLLIWMVIYLQVTAELFHCIVGSVEALYVVFSGGASLSSYVFDFLVPVVLGNTVGGVVFVATLNYAQFSADKGDFGERLSWRRWLMGQASS